MKRNRIIAVLLLLIILFTFSCCKKDEVDPFGNTVPEEMSTTENTTEAPSAEESTTEKGKILYATAVVNVREEPNTDCDVIGQLSLGESIELIEHLDNGWSAVRYSGEKYYISTQYLSEKKPSDKSDFVFKKSFNLLSD